MTATRTAIVERKTKETDILIKLNIDGIGQSEKIASGIPFIDHMLRLMAAHGYFDIDVDIVWRVVEEHLPGLKDSVERMLEAEKKDPDLTEDKSAGQRNS